MSLIPRTEKSKINLWFSLFPNIFSGIKQNIQETYSPRRKKKSMNRWSISILKSANELMCELQSRVILVCPKLNHEPHEQEENQYNTNI